MTRLGSSHAFAQAVKLINPGPSRRDADDTTDLPGEPQTTDGRADLWQLETAEVDADGTVLADWAGVFDPGSVVTSATEVRDVASDALFRVHGRPEEQRSLLTNEVAHIYARLKFISDQQGAPS